jgi:hypothetical protein
MTDRPASWVIVNKATGKAVFETYRQETADAINRDRYHVLGIGEYLGGLNSAIKDGTSEPDEAAESASLVEEPA